MLKNGGDNKRNIKEKGKKKRMGGGDVGDG